MTKNSLEQLQADLDAAAAHIAKAAKRLSFIQEQNRKNRESIICFPIVCSFCKRVDHCICSENDLGYDFVAKG